MNLPRQKGENRGLKGHPTNINNTINGGINNVVVFPTAYGKEDIDYICQKLGDIVGPLIKHQTFSSIPCLFEKIHKNWGDTSFNNKPKKTVIDQIIEDKRSILNNYADSNEKQLGRQVLDKYEKYQDKLDSDPSFRRNLELEIGGLLLDMKSIIANDEKTRNLLQKVDEGNFELD
jgi:hypothetical protein